MGKAQCGMDIVGKCGKAYYLKILGLLENYFEEKNWKRLFLTGGCYWFADFLHRGISGSDIMINRVQEHCALAFENGVYDITGQICSQDFHLASDREICFMKKHYIPKFDTQKLERYLVSQGTV